MTIIIKYMRFKNVLIFCALLFVSGSLFAQVNKTDQNPVKIGLVLSGGGAKGLAHIGVLKEIEAAGIKIDYIGGTSMGAIVGALYASGYTAHQLDSIFTTVDFERLIQDDLPRSAKTFYEKEDSEKYAITLPFDDFKIAFPSALSKGQNIYNLFTQLTDHVKNVREFDKLPIPFFCVATDVEKGTAVILDEGYLPQAISASGALPSLFSPVVIDKRLLIDGGVVNNYPVEELKDRGMEYIIGVDVQDTLRMRDQLQSAPEILLQINNYRTIQAMNDKIKETDIYVKPDIENYTVVDFDLGKQIIDKGQEKAQEYLPQLRELALKQASFYKKPKLAVEIKDSIYIKSINITGNAYYTRSYVLGKLKFKPPGPTTYNKIIEGINNLSATGNFTRINHRLENYDDGSYHLDLQVRETENTTFVRAGVHYDDLYKSAALGNITKKRLLFKNDVASLDLILGDNIRYELDYYSDNGFYISFGLKSYYNSFERRVNARFIEQLSELPLEELNNVPIEYSDFTNQFYIQTLFEKQFSLNLGIEHKLLVVETETIRQEVDAGTKFFFEDSHYFSTFGQLRLDTFDNKYFPSQGWFFNGDFHLYVFSSDYNNTFNRFSVGIAQLKYATPVLPKVSMVVGVEGGFKIGGESINSLDFFLGGWGNDFKNNIIPFYGYDFISAAGDGLVKASILFDYKFYGKNHFNAGANFANIENKLFSSGNWFSSPDYTGYFLGYGLETFLGPIQVKYSYSPEIDQSLWYFSLGFWF